MTNKSDLSGRFSQRGHMDCSAPARFDSGPVRWVATDRYRSDTTMGNETTADGESSGGEIVPVYFIAYEDQADLEIVGDEDPQVANHDELVKEEKTYGIIRGLRRSKVEEYDLHHDVIEPGDMLWDDRLEELEIGETIRADELRQNSQTA